jgi:hypothetical protein
MNDSRLRGVPLVTEPPLVSARSVSADSQASFWGDLRKGIAFSTVTSCPRSASLDGSALLAQRWHAMPKPFCRVCRTLMSTANLRQRRITRVPHGPRRVKRLGIRRVERRALSAFPS